MKRLLSIFVLCLLLPALRLLAVDTWSVNGRQVSVKTERFDVQLDGLAITRITNLLTGEVYARQPVGTRALGAAFLYRTFYSGIAVESLRPAVPVKYYGLGEKTVVAAKRLPHGVQVIYTGLQSGQGGEVEYNPKMTITLTLSVDEQTGDLLIVPDVKGNIEEVFGVRDRGVFRNTLHLTNLDGGLRVILPVNDGVSFTRETAPKGWAEKPAVWSWPGQWQAGLFIAEGAKGCLGIWADEPQLHYSRNLSLCRDGDDWQAGFEFETTDMNYRCDDITGAAWRLNVFASYWAKAAERYRRQMQAQWKLQPLSAGKPAWADRVRIVVNDTLPDPDSAGKIAAAVPAETVALFTRQGWSSVENPQPVKEPAFPTWPPGTPMKYEAEQGFAGRVKALEGAGFHAFPYTSSAIIKSNHPWAKKGQTFSLYNTWTLWQRFYPEACRDFLAQTGGSGIYESYSASMGRHVGGESGNWYQGSVVMADYFRQLLPETALMSEYNNEVTCRGRQFALAIPRMWEYAHPINSYLFEPFIRVWNYAQPSEALDADDIRGCLTAWPSTWADQPTPLQAHLRARGELFAREQLTSFWPEAWDPRVLHYYKGKDGAEYRCLRDNGTRMVKVTPQGEATLYWRLSGVQEADIPGRGIDGWPAWDGAKAIGLNPEACYPTRENAPHPPAVIAALPKGYVIRRLLTGERYWMAYLDAPGVDPLLKPDAPLDKIECVTATVRVRTGNQPVTFGGADAVKKLSDTEYELQVKLPGGILACWADSHDLEPGGALGGIPAQNMIRRAGNGEVVQPGEVLQADSTILTQACGRPELGEEGVITWMVKLPKLASYLVFQYGSGTPAGDGANYLVCVNGRPLWKRYRSEQWDDPDKRSKRQPVPLKYGAVDLAEFEGQTVLIELAANGHYSTIGESIAWHNPELRDAPPRDAEMDSKPKDLPENPEAEGP